MCNTSLCSSGCSCKCPCGYDKNARNAKLTSRDLKCSVTRPLLNHVTFPSVRMMPKTHSPQPKDSIYIDNSGRVIKHWASIFQMIEKADPNKSIFAGILSIDNPDFWLVHNSHGEKFALNVWGKAKHLNLKPGFTLALLYPTYDACNRVDIGYNNCIDTCYVFNASLIELCEASECLLEDADLKSTNRPRKCFECRKSEATLRCCANCRLAQYCSRECQTRSWSAHKKLCKQSDMLLKFACLQRITVSKDQFSFRETIDDSSKYRLPLPPYEYVSQFEHLKAKTTNVLGSATSRLNIL